MIKFNKRELNYIISLQIYNNNEFGEYFSTESAYFNAFAIKIIYLITKKNRLIFWFYGQIFVRRR